MLKYFFMNWMIVLLSVFLMMVKNNKYVLVFVIVLEYLMIVLVLISLNMSYLFLVFLSMSVMSSVFSFVLYVLYIKFFGKILCKNMIY